MSAKEDYEILVIDDNNESLLILKDILKNAGYNVTCIGNSNEGLVAAKSGNFDLILLDIVMNEMNGFDVCKKLKNDPKTRDIPVIFITITDEVEYIKKGFELGAADYLTKPFNKFEILARVKQNLMRNYTV